MSTSPGWYVDPGNPTLLRWWDGANWTAQVAPEPVRAAADLAAFHAQLAELNAQRERVQREIRDVRDELRTLTNRRDELRHELRELASDAVEARDVMLLQEVGIYRYSHPLDSAAAYKQALADLEAAQDACVKANQAVTGTTKWAINGSEKEGAKMIGDVCKLMLRAYNAEADSLVRTLKPYALPARLERLQKTRTAIAKLGASMKIEITEKFHLLRVKELELTADYLERLAVEKEHEREERVRLRDEELARKELAEKQEKLEKERTHYETVLAALRAKGDERGATAAAEKLGEINAAIDGVIARAANIRAGYVYVISNIGAFGERVVKIGLTRRENPLERVLELGGASVPFRFDVHATIFSDDAVGLEHQLHQQFAGKRVNLVNARREYFYTTPVEVRDALLALRGNLLTFHETPEALEWRQSENVRKATAQA